MPPPVSPAAYVGPDHPAWIGTLADGRTVLVRPLGRADAAADRAFLSSLSPEARRDRFLGQVRCPGAALMERLTDIDYVNDVALAAIAPNPGEPRAARSQRRIVGVSRYAVDANRDDCECAVAVADDWRGVGLGTLLMQRLIQIARERGLATMRSIDFASNTRMQGLARRLGFTVRRDPDDARQVVHSLALDRVPRAQVPAANDPPPRTTN